MLQLSSKVYDFFELVLASSTKFVLDYIEENSGISETMLEEDFEFPLYNKHSDATLNLLPILLQIV